MTTPTNLPNPPYSYQQRGFYPLIKAVKSATVDPANCVSGSSVSGTVTVPGAALGDYVMISFSLDLQGLELGGYVNDGDSVTWTLQNQTGGAINLASGTMRIVVFAAVEGQPPTI